MFTNTSNETTSFLESQDALKSWYLANKYLTYILNVGIVPLGMIGSVLVILILRTSSFPPSVFKIYLTAIAALMVFDLPQAYFSTAGQCF